MRWLVVVVLIVVAVPDSLKRLEHRLPVKVERHEGSGYTTPTHHVTWGKVKELYK